MSRFYLFRFTTAYLFLMCFAAPVVLAATTKDLAVCAAKSNSVERLACYDDLAKAENATSPDTTTNKVGNWDIKSETSKIDDKTNVMLTLESDDYVRDRFGRSSKALVIIACREGHTDFYLTFGGNFLSDIGGYGDVTLRLDKQTARTVKMNVSTDNKALGLWNESGKKLLKSMFGANKLFVQVVPYNESAITAEFSIGGIEQASAPLQRACKW